LDYESSQKRPSKALSYNDVVINMKKSTNIISPAALVRKPISTRSKIIERVRKGNDRKSPNPAQLFAAEMDTTRNCTNVEVPYMPQLSRGLDKALSQEHDEISSPTTATNSNDSMSTRDSVFGDWLAEEKDTRDVVDEGSSDLTDIAANINTDINTPGVGFAGASINNRVAVVSPEKNKNGSRDDNSILEDDPSEAASPQSEAASPQSEAASPQNRFFNCGGADLGNELIEDLSLTMSQIMSPVHNVRAVRSFVSEKNDDFKNGMRDKIRWFRNRRSRSSDVVKRDVENGGNLSKNHPSVRPSTSGESSNSGNSKIFSSKLDADGNARKDMVRVGSPEFKAMMSRRMEV
jgi:hypothetical protein